MPCWKKKETSYLINYGEIEHSKTLTHTVFFLSHVIPMEETHACLSRCHTVEEVFSLLFLDEQYRKAGEASRLAQIMIDPPHLIFMLEHGFCFTVTQLEIKEKLKSILPIGKKTELNTHTEIYI
jgi:hypothetical protein